MIERVIENTNWNLTPDEVTHFNEVKTRAHAEGKPMVLWGWKRDRIVNKVLYPDSRTIYFAGDLKENNGVVTLDRGFFYLDTRAKKNEIEKLCADMNMIATNDLPITVSTSLEKEYPGYARLRIAIGAANEYDRDAIARRIKGKPRVTIAPPQIAPECTNYNISKYAPFALCVGSGLSSESGLPLLGSIHNLFEVDNFETGELIFGAADGMPKKMAANPVGEFKKFCQFAIDAIKARPSPSHWNLSQLYKKGIALQTFTDNMDDILSKVDVPYIRTRQGIFPDRYKVQFDKWIKSLLVIGIAVDRRQVIRQARRQGLKIIVINPLMGVAPHSRNMDYMRTDDIFYRGTAHEILPKIIESSGF